jgi:hypothetical protein
MPRDLTRILAEVLSHGRDGVPWEGRVDDDLLAAAYRHDVAPLLYRALHDAGVWDRQTGAARDRLAESAREAVLRDEWRVKTDRLVVAMLVSAGLAPLIFKGAALAQTVYPQSWLRSRVDTDLLIREDDRAAAAAVFEDAGFTRVPRPIGDHVTHQFTYIRMAHGIRDEYDVHWKIADPQAFADVVTYDELAARAVPVSSLGLDARAIGAVHALLIACTHRVAHHYDRDTLQFLYDVDLLSRRFDAGAWNEATAIASEKKIRAVFARGLGLAEDLLGTPVPQHVTSALAIAAGEREDSADYLRRDLRRVDILRSDLKVLGWSARVRLLREHLMPPPEYMLASYGTRRAALLPALYVHRIVRGAVKWFRPLR